MNDKLPVAIVGASGYTALELARLLARHPKARLAYAASRQEAGTRLDAIHPALAGRFDLVVAAYDPDELARQARVAFLALPHVTSMETVPGLRARGVIVIDLSADYRLKDAGTYEQWYHHAHNDPSGLSEAVYGLPELFRERIRSADLIANPGCYTTASILGLAPLLAGGVIQPRGIVIDAKSGVSGAGRAPKLGTLFAECNESLAAYGIGNHRHTPEIEQVLGEVCGQAVEVIFTPHLVPMNRGILATIYADPVGNPKEGELLDLFRSYYRSSPFVRVMTNPPATKDSAHSNYCDLTVKVVRGKVLVVSCLDNLVKGASGVAVQNLNVRMGWPETEGLEG